MEKLLVVGGALGLPLFRRFHLWRKSERGQCRNAKSPDAGAYDDRRKNIVNLITGAR